MHLRLENFDGPLDLLLHLIRSQEINIFNIPITTITAQYLSFLKQVPEVDFHIAGEYLAMSAQLIEIKAKMLLPTILARDPDYEPESLEEMDADDPRRALVEQLMSYEALKEAVNILEKRPLLGRDVFPSGESKRREEDFSSLQEEIKGDPFSLVIALERVLLRYAQERKAPTVKVKAQRITIQQKMFVIVEAMEKNEQVTLQELFLVAESRYELIVTIMAVLELSKVCHIILSQAELFAPIIMTKGENFGGSLEVFGESTEQEASV